MNKDAILDKVMQAAPVIPVVVIDDASKAVDLARALVAGGLPAIEITLRTPRAVECIKAVADEVDGAMAGAGTVLGASQLEAVCAAGARFVVSPGVSPGLLDAAGGNEIPLLPGAATASEMMTLGERGFTRLKFFPAEAAGGVNYLKSLASPLPEFKICPTGGVDLENAGQYLALSNVVCVGGSWVAPAELIDREDWKAIEMLARRAAALVG